ncbi:SusC/RagA family TonB-linked outer membrane protein [Prevotella sp. kh1p2]|uniref:SusC/RagA family TonB-linked outer membrane protein n=1 Tax=Prevotella sp. kh1p2 TaxID=1761883 RepID=UPI0008B1A19F|nr:TonB-dependent receptor [Prevotella sp. kh1p2]SES83188.1 TonB-linked outer membrane protein, SusC/RagA family [Prevotella sp. kh1p2]SNU10825.1 TonB-linked outer membrane protein, SusC/RagA family [Prevotellaceae bacterium KH2P17]
MEKRLMTFLACLFLSLGMALAQTRVSGTVVSQEDGEPVVGASVRVEGTNTGTVTDVDGRFSLSAPAGSKLTISYIGMVSQTVTAAPNMTVRLVSDNKVLDEVMVVAYGTTTKASFTGSAESLKDRDFSAEKGSLVKSLDGKMAGVRVGSSIGDPGANQSISIRGIGSINGSTQPLYVVDGVALTDSPADMTSEIRQLSVLSSLNPNDIESMTVLKDAAAASLYGSRAANGVVIITTKSGKSGKTRVTYDGSVGWTGIAKPSALEAMNASELKEYYTYALKGYFQYREGMDAAAAMEAAKAEIPNGWFRDYEGTTDTDWYKEVYRHGFTTDHQLSINGGSDKTKFFVSMGYNNVKGVVRGTDFNRYSGRINLDHQVNDWFKISAKQMVSFTDSKGIRDQGDQAQGFGTTAPMSILFSMDPTATVKLEDGSYNPDAAFSGSKISNPHLMLGQMTGDYAETINSEIVRSLSNLTAEVKLPYNFLVREIFGFDYVDNKTREFWSPSSVNGESVHGMGERWGFTNKTLTSSTTLNYANVWGKHNFDALLGYEVEKKNLLGQYLQSHNYATAKLPELSNGVASGSGSYTYEANMLSWLGRANYNYDNKYYASLSFRRDGSSRLGKDNRWSNFWSVSGAWRISGEEFLKDSQLFSDLKVRASYGTNGNLPTDYYGYMGTYATTGAYGSDPAIFWANRENAKLGWEKSSNFNVGFDWTLYHKVTLTVEYYNKLTKDLLFMTPTSYVTGFGSQWQNLGRLKNSGVEFTVSSQNFRNKDFSWDTDFNLTWQSVKVDKLPNGDDVQYGDGNMYLLREGESMHTFFLPKFKGVNSETGLGEFWIDPEDESKGVTNYYSRAGKTIVGKAVPDVLGGITNRFTYKDFDLSFMISYQFGADMFDYPGYFLTFSDGVRVGNFNVSKSVVGKYWKQPGDKAEFPQPIYANPFRSDRFSSREIRSTDNIRVRDFTLGYTVPVSKNYIQNLRVYFRATNPFMIYCATKDVDPDVDINGYRQTDTPATRAFQFGVNLTF